MRCDIVIIGYATLDYVLATPSPLTGAGTVSATLYTKDAWPRPGGAALYAARRLRAVGHRVWPVVSVGDDTNGTIYRAACRDAEIATDGLAEIEGAKTPCCLIAYHDDGQYTCLLDPGSVPAMAFTPRQSALIDAADLVVVAAADARLIAEALLRVDAGKSLAWIVKDDPACFPVEICRALAQRADFIFSNSAELVLVEPFLAEAEHEPLVFETLGVAGVRMRHGRHETLIPTIPIEAHDTTGAGDTFAGEVLAALMTPGILPEAAARRGVDQARLLLQARQA